MMKSGRQISKQISTCVEVRLQFRSILCSVSPYLPCNVNRWRLTKTNDRQLFYWSWVIGVCASFQVQATSPLDSFFVSAPRIAKSFNAKFCTRSALYFCLSHIWLRVEYVVIKKDLLHKWQGLYVTGEAVHVFHWLIVILDVKQGACVLHMVPGWKEENAICVG